ncbi:DUF2093 domain-containing protein [Bartonella sp. DGB2]|uniref:DUF2093 domain-containing protein n=1 Tax=Bartonella sp. DGB2 TaxID=3388426 RepID=UPI00399014F7
MLSLGQSEAKLTYQSGDFRIKKPGNYVTCAISGAPIPLDELKYWSFTRQEAYATCEISYQRELECNPRLRSLLHKTLNKES